MKKSKVTIKDIAEMAGTSKTTVSSFPVLKYPCIMVNS